MVPSKGERFSQRLFSVVGEILRIDEHRVRRITETEAETVFRIEWRE